MSEASDIPALQFESIGFRDNFYVQNGFINLSQVARDYDWLGENYLDKAMISDIGYLGCQWRSNLALVMFNGSLNWIWLGDHYNLRRSRWLRRGRRDNKFEGIGRFLRGWVIVLECHFHFIGTRAGVIVLWRQLESWEFSSDKLSSRSELNTIDSQTILLVRVYNPRHLETKDLIYLHADVSQRCLECGWTQTRDFNIKIECQIC